jgi:hypothetical protein
MNLRDIVSVIQLNRERDYNDQNREDKLKYVDFNQCNYMIKTISGNFHSRINLREEILLHQNDIIDLNHQNRLVRSILTKLEASEFDIVGFSFVLDINRSKSSVTRAYYIPFVSSKLNIYQAYILFRKV